MENIDITITQAINALNSHVAIFDLSIIWLGKAIIPIMIGLMMWNWFSVKARTRARYVSICAGLSLLLALGINHIILLFIVRPRPYDVGISHLIVNASQDPSFPSDHAAAAFGIAFAIILLKHSWRNLFFLMASFLAFDRVFIGIHYFGDVMGGMLTGFIAALVITAIFQERSLINQRLIKLY